MKQRTKTHEKLVSGFTEAEWKGHAKFYGLDIPAPYTKTCLVETTYTCNNCGWVIIYSAAVDAEKSCPGCAHRPSHSLRGVFGVDRGRILGRIRSLGAKTAHAIRRAEVAQ